MSADQSHFGATAGEAVQQFQADSAFRSDLPTRPPVGRSEELPAETDIVSLAMRQFYQSPANAAG